MPAEFKRASIIFGGILLLIVLAFSCGDSPSSSSNGMGACSHHNGVNCAASADSDGSVICNDGWEDSSVAYSEVRGG